MNVFHKFLFLLKRKKALAIIFVILLISVPLIIIQLGKRQDLRQRASATDVSFLIPETVSIPIDQTNNATVTLQTAGNNIVGIEFTITFDKSILELISFDPTSTFPEVFKTPINTANQNGALRYIGTNTSTTPNTAPTIPIGTLVFKGKANGTSTVGFTSITVTAISPQGQAVTLQTANNTVANYTVSQATTPTGTTPTGTTPTGTSPTTTVPSSTPIPTSIPPTSIPPTVVATCPPPSTSSPPTNSVQFVFTVTLPSIGSQGNSNPKNCNRTITVQLFNATTNNQVGSDLQGTISFDNISQNFKGFVNAGNLAAGQYYLNIAVPQHIRKLVPGFQTASGPGNVNVSVNNLVVGNITNHNQVDIQDYNAIISCYNKSANGSCTASDLDDDGIVGPIDLNIFLRSKSVIRGD